MSHVGHELAALEFQAENQPIEGMPKYNAEVIELAAKVRNGDLTKEEAEDAALDTLAAEAFKGFGNHF